MPIQQQWRSANALITFAALVVVIAGMKASAPVLVPFLLAVFISVISTPALYWLRERGIPMVPAFVFVFMVILVVAGLLFVLVSQSVQDFSRNLPDYTTRVESELGDFFDWLKARGVNAPEDYLLEQITPDSGFGMFNVIISAFGNALGNTLIVLVMVFFILLEAAVLPAKLHAVSEGRSSLLERSKDIVISIRHYMAAKTFISLITGILIGFALSLIGVDYAVLWGVIAFLFNFVPSIGSIIAAIPATLLAFLQLGLLPAIYTAVVYLVINILLGNFIEPRYMGHRLGLSALIVFLSLVLWGWVLGPIGMLLSVPLTMAAKIALSSSDETRWIAILLGDNPARDSGTPPIKRHTEAA